MCVYKKCLLLNNFFISFYIVTKYNVDFVKSLIIHNTEIFFKILYRCQTKNRKLIKTTAMSTETSDLPMDIQRKVIEELRKYKFVLEDNIPMKDGDLKYTYKTRSSITNNLGKCKITVFPKELTEQMRCDMMKSVEKEVIIC